MMGTDKINTPLIHCVFTSSTWAEMDEQAFLDLVARHKDLNQGSDSITGLMLYEGGNFFQVLEGPQDQVDAMYQAISLDSSYRKVVKIVEERIEGRDFKGLSSAYGTAVKNLVASTGDKEAYFSSEGEFSRVCAGRAKKLVREFVGGRWRLVKP